MAKLRIGLYGGTFDPVHHGHLIIARSVMEQCGLSKVVLIPSAQPPHKQNRVVAAAEHRLEMVKLAVEGEPGFEWDDCELRRSGPSYTLVTVREFQQRLGTDVEVCWIIGADSLPELGSWYRIGELVDVCRIIIASRPGWEQPDLAPLRVVLSEGQIERLKGSEVETPQIDVSATDIRQRMAAGQSIRFLVPEAVRKYLQEKNLYRY